MIFGDFSRFTVGGVLLALFCLPAQGEDGFILRQDGALVHAASGFTCPETLGVFRRDAAGLREGGQYCAYSAVSGIYGTIFLKPIAANYDPKAVLAPEARSIESQGGIAVTETEQPVGAQSAAVTVYLRTYEMARLDALTYRAQLATAAIGAFAVEVEIEYAFPRDKAEQTGFVTAVYGEAIKDMAGAP